MDDSKLKKLHGHLLNALLEVDRICKKNRINYFITGGTLLGAVRHKGFIPWDDDLDIGMLRDDYERFLKIAPNELGNKFILQTCRNEPDYFLPFCKVRINGTKFMRANEANLRFNQGVFIDIFPIDNVPKSRFFQLFHSYTTKILMAACTARSRFIPNEDQSHGRHYLYRAMKCLTRIFKLTTLTGLLEKAMRMAKKNRSGMIVNIGGAYGYGRETFPLEYLGEYINVEFEEHEIQTMGKWHEYLTKIYGNYMILPPESKRTTGHEPEEMQL